MKKTTLLALALPALIAFLAWNPFFTKKARFHSEAELAYFRSNTALHGNPVGQLPIDSNILFPTAKTCGGCHGHDPNGFAMVTTSGVDVNIYDAWRSTMMANSARDPFWRAKVTHEILVNPEHSLELQDKCTSCHAPAGHYQAKLKAHEEYYTLYDMYNDTLGLDGVTCQACHAQSDFQIGLNHSGQLNFDTNYIRVAYGPYEFIFAPPMHEFVGITPQFGWHTADGGLCAGCHTLITNTVDLNGQFTGNTFVEQATYHEWLNSRYDKEHDNISCQKCHVPNINDEIIISANYQFLTPKFPYALHEMAGANVTMLKLMKNNIGLLDIPATATQYDSTIAATLRMLQEKTLDLSLTPVQLQGDTMKFDLRLGNKAGHKFPSGYPSRRAWVELELLDANGNSLFHSGAMNADYTLANENAGLEPHYNVISSEDQVQIYELVPGDVNGNFTNVLERGHIALKDNRLAPQGFSSTDPVYDTTTIVGAALQDPDFNRMPNGTEGSGADILHFHVPNTGYEGEISVSVKVWYQSLPPKWMDPMFAYSSPEIDSFKQMYQAADRSPTLVATASLEHLPVSTVGTQTPASAKVEVFPTLSTDGRVWVTTMPGDQLVRVRVWSSSGVLLLEQQDGTLQLPNTNGVYLVDVQTRKGKKTVRVVRGGR
ncbi:MAG: hypothetical protein IPL65_16205 [Lewinellaceae bacterium]|nr:hypothetical protein [Lewinellaceae bacterium]